MSELKEIQTAIEFISKIEEYQVIANGSCRDLVNTVNDLIQRINQNNKVIDNLAEEIKYNQSIIEEYEAKNSAAYDLDDGFISMKSKKNNY
jgi:hypothetical protein